MADRNALGLIGLLFGAATIFVVTVGAVVVGEHLTGRQHLDDGLATAALPMSPR